MATKFGTNLAITRLV